MGRMPRRYDDHPGLECPQKERIGSVEPAVMIQNKHIDGADGASHRSLQIVPGGQAVEWNSQGRSPPVK